MAAFNSGFSILFHWSIFLFLCQYHTVLMTVDMYHNLKSGRLVPPAPLLLLKISLSIQDLFFVSIQIVKFFCFSYVKNAIGYLIRISLNL